MGHRSWLYSFFEIGGQNIIHFIFKKIRQMIFHQLVKISFTKGD